MSIKISAEEQLYYQTEQIAGELSILIQGVKRVNGLLAEFQEIPLMKLDKEVRNKIKKVQEASQIVPIAGTLLISATLENLILLKSLQDRYERSEKND